MSDKDDFLEFTSEREPVFSMKTYTERAITDMNRKVTQQIRDWMTDPTPETVERSYEYLKEFYQAVAPMTYEVLSKTTLTHRQIIDSVVSAGIYLYFPDGKMEYSVEELRALIVRFGRLSR